METETKSSRILDIIAKSSGMRFTDIQKALWEMNHPKGTFTRKQRGYWCDNLLGCHYPWKKLLPFRQGLLERFCVKGKDGLWRRNKKAIVNSPWKDIYLRLRTGKK